jgi:hypothetical protein
MLYYTARHQVGDLRRKPWAVCVCVRKQNDDVEVGVGVDETWKSSTMRRDVDGHRGRRVDVDVEVEDVDVDVTETW